MKPLKFLTPASDWLMRAGVLLFIVLYYLELALPMNPGSVMFWLALGFLVFGTLLFAAGFFRSSRPTVVAALALTLLTGYHAVIFVRAGLDYNFAAFVVLGSVLIHFLARGRHPQPADFFANSSRSKATRPTASSQQPKASFYE